MSCAVVAFQDVHIASASKLRVNFSSRCQTNDDCASLQVLAGHQRNRPTLETCAPALNREACSPNRNHMHVRRVAPLRPRTSTLLQAVPGGLSKSAAGVGARAHLKAITGPDQAPCRVTGIARSGGEGFSGRGQVSWTQLHTVIELAQLLQCDPRLGELPLRWLPAGLQGLNPTDPPKKNRCKPLSPRATVTHKPLYWRCMARWQGKQRVASGILAF